MRCHFKSSNSDWCHPRPQDLSAARVLPTALGHTEPEENLQ
jgi:hypothetical protein